MRYYTQLGVDFSIGSRSSSFGFVYYTFLSILIIVAPKYFMEMIFLMSNNQKLRSDQEWLALFQECRTSGMTDKDWCEMKGISPSSFYKKISRLRKKNYDILNVTKTSTRSVQEVVPLDIVDNLSSANECRNTISNQPTEFVPAVVIHTKDLSIQISNNAAKDTILSTLLAVEQLC